MAQLTYITDGVVMPQFNQELAQKWIEAVARGFGKSPGNISYIFCNDEKIIEVNRRFLQHDYYTDVITFDYSRRHRISGDIFISLDTVASNAEMVGATVEKEFRRVFIHGILHLCGVNDNGPGEREIMQQYEDEALMLLDTLAKEEK